MSEDSSRKILEYRMSWEICIPYAGEVGMVLLRYWKKPQYLHVIPCCRLHFYKKDCSTNWKCSSEIKADNSIDQGDKTDFFTCEGTVIFLRKENCMYRDSAEPIPGTPADELGDLKDTNEATYDQTFQDAMFKSYFFRLRTKLERYNDESRLKTICLQATPAVWAEQCRRLIEGIEK